jgi:hypothetical protein
MATTLALMALLTSLGVVTYRVKGRANIIDIPDYLRERHIRIAGGVGTGKTSLAAMMALSDALRKEAVPIIIIDPHGTLIDYFLSLILLRKPAERENILGRLRYWEPARRDWVHCFPFLEHRPGVDAYRASQEFIETCYLAWPYLQEGAPVFADIGTATLMSLYAARSPSGKNYQITEALHFLRDKGWRTKILKQCKDTLPHAEETFNQAYDRWANQLQLERRYSFENKITPFCYSESLQATVGGDHSTIPWDKIYEDKLIVCINLRGLEDDPMVLLGTSVIKRFSNYLFAQDPDRTEPVSLIVDEASDFLCRDGRGAGQVLERFCSKARKWKLFLCLIMQQVNQAAADANQVLWNLETQIIFKQTEFQAALEAARNMFDFDPQATRFDPQREGQFPEMWQVGEQDRQNTSTVMSMKDRYCLVRVGVQPAKAYKVPALPFARVNPEKIQEAKEANLKAFARARSEVLNEIRSRTQGENKQSFTTRQREAR